LDLKGQIQKIAACGSSYIDRLHPWNFQVPQLSVGAAAGCDLLTIALATMHPTPPTSPGYA
jgi:hypothetical protein